MSKKITIIGGSGFVGTNLCKHFLAKQIEFEIIDLKMSRQFPEYCKIGDVRDRDNLKDLITGNIIINLAALHRDNEKNKYDYYATNVIGAENIVAVSNEKNIKKIIFTSTVAVYGFAYPGTDENGEINPFNEYGHTKYAAENKFRSWQSQTKNSLIIVRPTVIFGEGNRGNVYNLFNQIAVSKFLMVGKGCNKKSMAYIGNIVAFLEACVFSKQNYAIYNYTDSPDLTTNELVSLVRKTLLGRDDIGVRLPYWLGMLLGYVADIISKITGKSLPISSIRVKKFVSNSQFIRSNDLNSFVPPFQLVEGIERTLKSEFIFPDKDREIFYTE